MLVTSLHNKRDRFCRKSYQVSIRLKKSDDDSGPSKINSSLISLSEIALHASSIESHREYMKFLRKCVRVSPCIFIHFNLLTGLNCICRKKEEHRTPAKIH